MAYSKLLLNAGGGIISTKQQAEQAKNTASVLIGLGGTGIDCLRTIKTQVYSRLLPDNKDAVIPEYKHIRFLGVDSDEASVGKKVAKAANTERVDARRQLDETTEFFSIVNPEVGAAIKNRTALDMRPEMSWLSPETPPPHVGSAGAGAIRQIGRFMIMDKADGFMHTLESAIRGAMEGLNGPTVNIHVFAGISGGTGSGTFLDVCYMIRKVTQGMNVKIFGYFFLPDVNLSRIALNGNEIVHKMIKQNGYAAMQELDYCMNLPENGGSFVQRYKGGVDISWDQKPVDMCHLICASDEAGNVIANPYEYAMNVAAEYVMDFLTAPMSDDFSLASHQANFVGQVAAADNQKIMGVNLYYAVIGAASASIPLREINTYLASELFDKFSGIGTSVPTKADVEALAVGALGKGIQAENQVYESLLREIEENANPGSFNYYDQDFHLVLEQGDEDFAHHYANQRAAKLNKVAANANSMMDAGNTASLLGRVRRYLENVLRDVHRGPIFAYRMLEAAQTHNLGNVIDGLIRENDSRLGQARYERENNRKNYEGARADFLNRRKRGLLDNDAKRFGDYEAYTQAEVTSQLRVEIYEQMEVLLHKVRQQIREVTTAYYGKLARVMQQLLETFAENKDVLDSGSAIRTDTFSIPMITIQEIEKTLEEEIRKINVPNMMAAFMDLLIDNESEWILEDENKIAKLVTQFFVETAFGDFANRSITLFLQDKYADELGTNKNDVQQLADIVYENWMKRLTAKASPLFVKDTQIQAVNGTSEKAYISMPNACAAITAAADKMKQANQKWDKKESALTDRIFVMCSRYVVPMCSYRYQSDYGQVYSNAQGNGIHLYEGANVPGMEFNNWKKLAPITPQSYIKSDVELEKVREAQTLFEQAYTMSVFGDANRICAPDPAGVAVLRSMTAECRKAAAAIASPADGATKKPLLAQLEDALVLPMHPTGYSMQNDGQAEPTVKQRVLKDHFVASPNLQIKVKEIVSTLKPVVDEAKTVKEDLEAKILGVSAEEKDIAAFCNAIVTGVVTMTGPVVKYSKLDMLGQEQGEILSQFGADYPFAAIPVYQGYINYKALPQAKKDEIANEANNRFNGQPEVVMTAATKVKAVLAPNVIQGYGQFAATLPQANEILGFLNMFMQKFNATCLMFGVV